MVNLLNIQAMSFALWGLLAAVWGIGLLKTKRTSRVQSSGSRLVQTGLLIGSFILLFREKIGLRTLDEPLFSESQTIPLIGLGILALGIAIAIWARLYLGTNWSGRVTLKADHVLISGGPYRLARHPIYTGVLLGTVGTALTNGSLHAFLAVPLCAFSYLLKIGTEEQFLVAQFGAEYLTYKKRVRALIPFVF